MTEQLAPPDQVLDELTAVTRQFAETMSGWRPGSVGAGTAAAAEDWWAGLCEIGLERCLLPESDGGIELTPAALAVLLEELAAGDGAAALTALLSNIALRCLVAAGAGLPGTNERCILVPARGVRVDDAGRLAGTVPIAYDAGRATRLVVVAGTTGEGGIHLVTSASAGVRSEPVCDQLGLDGAPASTLVFDDTTAEPLGDGTDATAILHAGIAAIARGIARRAEAMALAYAEQRYQGGGPIIDHGAVRDMLARMAERRLAGRSSTAPGLAAALAARIVATDAAVATTTDAVQVFGGIGYMVETGVERLMRDAKACQLHPIANWLARDRLLELQR